MQTATKRPDKWAAHRPSYMSKSESRRDTSHFEYACFDATKNKQPTAATNNQKSTILKQQPKLTINTQHKKTERQQDESARLQATRRYQEGRKTTTVTSKKHQHYHNHDSSFFILSVLVSVHWPAILPWSVSVSMFHHNQNHCCIMTICVIPLFTLSSLSLWLWSLS